MTLPQDPVSEQLAGLRRELKLTWDAHEREHTQHEAAHAREHSFAQKATDTAAELAKTNKADANEWRGTMTDRESRFSTKDDVRAIMARLDSIEDAGLVAAERERSRLASESRASSEAERRISRSQWTIGLVVGLLATGVAILVNTVLRLAGS